MALLITKDIPGYEGFYQAKSNGSIISVPRKIQMWHGGFYWTKHKIKISSKDTDGNLIVCISKNGKQITITVHKLISLTFIGERPDGYVICHIDGNKNNNNVANIKYTTPRENRIYYKPKKSKSTKYMGVYYDKKRKKWIANIRINDKIEYLGSFNKKLNAENVYKITIKQIDIITI